MLKDFRTLCYKRKEKINKLDKGVQILIDLGNHWVVASSLITSKGKEVTEYDSIFLKWTKIL